MNSLMRGVSYQPYSSDLSHPGDRRRIAVWAKSYNIDLNLKMPRSGDVLVLSSVSNFSYWIEKHNGPIVLDLIDGYLSFKPSLMEDSLRNLIRAIGHRQLPKSLRFTNELKRAVRRSSCVVVSSPEQAIQIRKLTDKVNVILDDHSELARDDGAKKDLRFNDAGGKSFTLLWEGFGVTLKHLFSQSKAIEKFLIHETASLIIVTESTFKKVNSKYGRVRTSDLVKNYFPNSYDRVQIEPWSIERLSTISRECNLAVIPIDTNDKFALSKPENKLLSFWTLGLPVVSTPSQAYQRVMKAAKCEWMLVNDQDWSDKLTRFKNNFDDAQDSLRLGQDYILKNHSRTGIVEKWNQILRPLMES